MKSKKKKVNEKSKISGITLIALVITIIILVILAGISIASLSGENGLLGKTIKAAEEHNKSAAKEALNLKLSDIFLDKKDKNLSYLDDMKIEGYDVEVSNIGRIVTMTKDKKSYQFFVDSEYNVTELGEVTATTGSGGSGQSQGESKDYTDNLLYKVNFKELLESRDENITKVGTGIEVDETNTYATFDGKSGIRIDASIVDPESKLLGSTSKTITLWYRTDNTKISANHLAAIGHLDSHGGAAAITFNGGTIQFAVGWDECDSYISNETRFNNQWHFLVGVFEDGNTTRGYYDNVRYTGTGKYSTSDLIFTIGCAYRNDIDRFYKGDLADVRIYSSALTDEQVYQLYEYGKHNLKDK